MIDFGKYSYPRIKLKSPTGKVVYSATSSDAISRAMLGMTHPDLLLVVKNNELEGRLEKHFGKNTGHLRMIVGQALRSLIHKGGKVSIRGVTIRDLKQDIPWPEDFVEVPINKRPKK